MRRALPTDRILEKCKLGKRRPQGCELVTTCWLAENGVAGRWKEIWPAEQCSLKPSEAFGPWVECLQREWSGRIIPAVYGYEFNKSVRFWGYYGGVFINEKNAILADLSRDVWGLNQHYAFAVSCLPKLTHYKGIVVVLTTPEARGNYWHWTAELLPKISLLESLGIQAKEVTAFVVNTAGTKYEVETLQELLPHGAPIIPSSKRLHLSADRLVAFSSAPHYHDFHPRGILWLNGMRPRSSHKKTKIYVTRASAKKRRILNESALIPLLVDLGFELHDPSNLSVREQREIFQQANVVVGCHGAGLTNLVWCERGTCVVEIHAPAEPGLFYWRVCEILGLTYHPVFGTRRKGRRVSRSLDDDFLVDEVQFRSLLEKILSDQPVIEVVDETGSTSETHNKGSCSVRGKTS